jgi:REP element-mobilizing transposase RayT
MEEEPQFLDPRAELARHANRLPHWQQAGAAVFVTFRLADSLPRELLDDWREEREAWLRWNPEPWSLRQEREYRRRFTAAIEAWLDEAHGECLLRRADCARIVGEALRHFDGVRCQQHAWVIMPNHVHALFSLIEGHSLEKLIQSWKGYTARAINRLTLRNGAIWQKDYHDRIIRNAEHFTKCARYIRENPAKGHLKNAEGLLYETESIRELLAEP